MPETGDDLLTSTLAAPPVGTAQPTAFLKRLRRLLLLRYQAAQYLDSQDVRLLDRCIYAAYCDCLDLGIESEARRLLDDARAGRRPVRLGSS